MSAPARPPEGRAPSPAQFWMLLRLAPRGQLLALLGLMLLCGLTEGIGLVLLVPVLDGLGGAAGPRAAGGVGGWFQAISQHGSLAFWLAVFLLLVVLRSAAQFGRDRLGQHVQHHLVDALRARCFAALLAAEWRWLTGRRSSEHASLLLTDVSRVGVGLHYGLQLLAGLAAMAANLAAASLLSLPLTGIALASGALVFVALRGQRRHALSLGQGLMGANRAMHGQVQENLAGMRLAKTLGIEAGFLRQFEDSAAALRRQVLRFGISNGLSQACFQVSGAILLVGYLAIGLWWGTPVPVLLTLVLVFSRLIPQFMAAHQQLHHWLHAMPVWQQTQVLLEECRLHAEPAAQASRPFAAERVIEVRGVRVLHGERERPALDGVSLALPVRSTTAVMGASGAGKSTLADVLAGLVAPDQGQLLVDGQEISGAARHAWRAQVAYVPQDAFLFHDTIRANLLCAAPQASEDDLARALERAAAGFVAQLPQGLDTVVGDGGVRLSGGERQRIALARALLRRPSLLILDEATSALDMENERRIRHAIEQLHGDLTVLIIGHRIATLEHADQVAVLEHGRVKACGTWREIAPASTTGITS
ncbi:Putative multidrug export ATP-binding/permease protein [Pigmentiphaga humi]|uniref:Cyclolysin secretion/processing ATP-binding protein CyaB n=1 Tax=Pigmentiphaga humi TaxID=2478468 RepID=A0A3P4B333_9BURK|nr:ABC transporter ATP-binding protein [Pigmentiphaga humi]VCU70048.1 Putative multidrug export ATP-binding/permease protein [Pigmentiphaga humi]